VGHVLGGDQNEQPLALFMHCARCVASRQDQEPSVQLSWLLQVVSQRKVARLQEPPLQQSLSPRQLPPTGEHWHAFDFLSHFPLQH
jgi:hypothetical protein